jgi:D-glycero-D-manno-heptose 1,7-bisphosphate phosphatase
MSVKPPAVFLDRDGTMIHDPGYLCRLDELHWFPWTIDAVRLLNRAGFLVFVTTNQGGVGLGLYDETFVQAVHEAMQTRLAAGGARIDGWFYCMHHPRAVIDELRVTCDCRKPRPGMVRQAAEQFHFDVTRSFVVGDKLSDAGLADSVGARGILVRTGHGEEEAGRLGRGTPPAWIARNLMEATSWILRQSGHPHEAA